MIQRFVKRKLVDDDWAEADTNIYFPMVDDIIWISKLVSYNSLHSFTYYRIIEPIILPPLPLPAINLSISPQITNPQLTQFQIILKVSSILSPKLATKP